MRAVTIPVIANGDIGTASQAREALALSGAAGVMIGRAAQGKPWLPAALDRALETNSEITAPPALSGAGFFARPAGGCA
ncbi:MAG: tRNA-dihydrouridine synthase [Alphaproteobacteria bacterium]